MYPRIFKRIRDLILSGRYVVTAHAYDEMADDNMTIRDVERTVLTGTIRERQRDIEGAEWKYRVRGDPLVALPLKSF